MLKKYSNKDLNEGVEIFDNTESDTCIYEKSLTEYYQISSRYGPDLTDFCQHSVA